MIRQIKCDEVVALLLEHVATNHPALTDTTTSDDLRDWIDLVPD